MHSGVVQTMASFTERQHGQLQQVNVQNNVMLALEKLTLAQVCIAGAVALRHALAMADQT